jgi:hypothetical protein
MTGIVLPMSLNMKNQHMKIFYNILIPTFLVDCSFSDMPTKIARGGKNSLNPAKNPQLPKIPNPDKNPQALKIPLPNPKMVYQRSAPKTS